jgi:GTP cyclohydrolase I
LEWNVVLKNRESNIKTEAIDYDRVLALGRELLIALGEDPDREGIVDTPQRWASWWSEFINYAPGDMDTTFESISAGQLVVVSGIRVYSICEHHLLPFWCDVSIGYIPHEQVLGLSKFARIAHAHAHKLQLQERLVHEIALDVSAITRTPDVIVIAKGVHLCMQMRGIKSPATMSSLTAEGVFATSYEKRAEFLQLID